MKKIAQNNVSSDGILGARLSAMVITGCLFPLCIRYVYVNPTAVILFILSVLCLIAGRKKIKSFFTVSKLCVFDAIAYMGFVFLINAVVIVLFNMEEKVTESVPVMYRITVLVGLIGWNLITIPSNSSIAKFATMNYQRL